MASAHVLTHSTTRIHPLTVCQSTIGFREQVKQDAWKQGVVSREASCFVKERQQLAFLSCSEEETKSPVTATLGQKTTSLSSVSAKANCI